MTQTYDLPTVTLEMVKAGASAFGAKHANTCYPSAYDSECEEAAIAIYAAMEKARPHPDLPGDVVERTAQVLYETAQAENGNHSALPWRIARDGETADKWRTYARAALTAENLKAVREALEDLPRLIELQRTAAPEDKYEDGWNAGLKRAAEMVEQALLPSDSQTQPRNNR